MDKRLLPHSKEHTEKIRKALTGKPRKAVVGYSSYHRRVYQKRGNASMCEHCHTQDAKKYEWANVSGKFHDVNDYIQLCTSCHAKFDNKVSNIKLGSAICEGCGKSFKRRAGAQRFCGSKVEKTGCAYKNFNEYHLARYHMKRPKNH